MYIPSHFAERDPDTLRALIARHGFATLFSQSDDGPVASHLPLLFDERGGPHGRLLGHMARANEQWKSAAGQRVLAVFHGPHAYISPTWYAAQNVVPTWNYVTVHVTGTLQLVEDRDRLREVIGQLVTIYEANRPQPWSLESPDAEFVEKMLGGIVGFEIVIERIEGKWKLNQNHDRGRRERVIRALQEQGDADSLAIAELMRNASE